MHSRTTTRRSLNDTDGQLNVILIITNVSAAHLLPGGPERLHLLHRRGQHGDESANCHSEDEDARVLLPTHESSGSKEPESTREGVTNIQTDISAEWKVVAARAIILVLGDHSDLGRHVKGGLRTLHFDQILVLYIYQLRKGMILVPDQFRVTVVPTPVTHIPDQDYKIWMRLLINY